MTDPAKLRVHDPELCEGRPCSIHNPSDHHMKTWPLNWRGDRRLMERICPHGVGHPDPDHIAFARSVPFTQGRYDPNGTHGCDGCCDPSGDMRRRLQEPV